MELNEYRNIFLNTGNIDAYLIIKALEKEEESKKDESQS